MEHYNQILFEDLGISIKEMLYPLQWGFEALFVVEFVHGFV